MQVSFNNIHKIQQFYQAKSMSLRNNTSENHTAPSKNIAFYGTPILKKSVTNKVIMEKAKLSKQLTESLKACAPAKTYEELMLASLERARNILNYKKRKIKEYEKELDTIKQRAIYAKGKDRQALNSRARSLLKEYEELDKIVIFEEPKIVEPSKEFDYELITLFKTAIDKNNYDLKTIFLNYYSGLKEIETLEELKEKYPSINFPTSPQEVIAQRIVDTFDRSFYEEMVDISQNEESTDFANFFTGAIYEKLSQFREKYQISDANYEKISEIVNEKMDEIYISSYLDPDFSNIPTRRQYEIAPMNEIDNLLLNIDYDKFVLQILREHYLEGKKLNDIEYTENDKTIKVSDLRNSNYKYEKLSEKLKKMISDAAKIKALQRDYLRFVPEELKDRLEIYAVSELSDNEAIFNLITDFYNCRFTAEDNGFLIKLLQTLDKISDNELSIEEGVKYLEENHIHPRGTYELNALEEQRRKEELLYERMLNKRLVKAQATFDQALNQLHANKLNYAVDVCSAYYPKEANLQEIYKALEVAEIIRQALEISDKNLAQTKILRWDIVNRFENENLDPELLKSAKSYSSNFEFTEGKKAFIDFCEQINNSDKYQNEITIDETIKDGLKNTETTQHEEFVLNDDEITELFEDFNDLFNLSDKRDRIGQYLLNRHLIETFPESKILAPNPTILEKIMKEFGDNLDQATIQLCKYEDYCNLSESEKLSILDILKIYNYNDENDKVVLKYIIENDYINKDTSIVIERGNTTQERTICDSAKQGLFNKYKFPNSMKFFEKFELALPLDAPFRHAPGVKKINDALELKISGHDDRLVSENGDYRFNKFDPTGFHS